MANNKIENDGMHAMANVVAKNCVLRYNSSTLNPQPSTPNPDPHFTLVAWNL
jgi:hypothetical protein